MLFYLDAHRKPNQCQNWIEELVLDEEPWMKMQENGELEDEYVNSCKSNKKRDESEETRNLVKQETKKSETECRESVKIEQDRDGFMKKHD